MHLTNEQIVERAQHCAEAQLDYVDLKPLTAAPTTVSEILPGVEVRTHYVVTTVK